MVGNYGSNDVSVLRGTGTGTFQAALNYSAGAGPNGLALGDFNGDGKTDVAVADQNGNSAAILLNASLRGTEGQSLSGVLATIADTDGTATPANFSATIIWGDGQTSAVDSSAFSTNGDGNFSLNASHTYIEEGAYTIGITIGDTDGDSVTTSTSVFIQDAPLSVQPAAPTFSAAAGSPLAVGSIPDAVLATELDESGTPYLLVANYADNTISVLRGNSGGTFAEIGTYTVGGGPNGFVVGDFNRDDNPDVAVGDFASNQVSILLSNGDGTLQAAVNYAVGSGPGNVTALGDFNTDGNLDLATANFNDGTVSVLFGNGDGTFQTAATYAAGSGAIAVVAGDFDNDGNPDLATANYADNTVSLLRNNGVGTFAAPVTYAVGSNPWFIATSDLNADGAADLVTANFAGGVSVLLGNNDGTFQNARDFTAGTNPTAVVSADVTGDEIPDLVVSNYGSNDVSILVGTGDGSFQAPINLSAGSGPNGVTVGSLSDGDGYIAAANQNGNDLSILLYATFQANQGQPVTAVLGSVADANPLGDGSDLRAIIHWGDGTTSEVGATAFTANGRGGFDITAGHLYLATGVFNGTAFVFDHGAATAVDLVAQVVADPSGTGTVTIDQFNNSTPAVVSFDDGAGNAGTDNTLLTQFNVTYSAGPAARTFNTFCIDLFHTVSLGQSYLVNPRGDVDAAFANGSRMAYIYQHFGMDDLTSNPEQAVAVQLALWDLSLSNHNPTSFGQDPDGAYSSGDPSVFSVRLDGNPHAGAIAALTNYYLTASLGATTHGSWLDAAAAGTALNRGQSLLVVRPPEPEPELPGPCKIDPYLAEGFAHLLPAASLCKGLHIY